MFPILGAALRARAATPIHFDEVLELRAQNACMLGVAWGGGSASTALLLYLMEQKLWPDFVVIALTGAESEMRCFHILDNYQRLRELSRGKLPCLTVVRGKYPAGPLIDPVSSIYQDAHANRALPEVVPGTRSCAFRWKTLPMEFWGLNTYSDEVEGGIPIVMLLGLCGSGSDRLRRVESSSQAHLYCSPLRDLQWSRGDCADILQLHQVPRLDEPTCWLCPYQTLKQLRAGILRNPWRAREMVRLEVISARCGRPSTYWAAKGSCGPYGARRPRSMSEFVAADRRQGPLLPEFQGNPLGLNDWWNDADVGTPPDPGDRVDPERVWEVIEAWAAQHYDCFFPDYLEDPYREELDLDAEEVEIPREYMLSFQG